jgi:hypothetical protein
MIRTFDIAEDAWMLPIILHQNNFRPTYEKWPPGEQVRVVDACREVRYIGAASGVPDLHPDPLSGHGHAGQPGSDH